jgi:hypothetical protein
MQTSISAQNARIFFGLSGVHQSSPWPDALICRFEIMLAASSPTLPRDIVDRAIHMRE